MQNLLEDLALLGRAVSLGLLLQDGQGVDGVLRVRRFTCVLPESGLGMKPSEMLACR